MKYFFKAILAPIHAIARIEARINRMQEALGRIETRQIATSPATSFGDAEYRVFSQWGEDGILQQILSKVPTTHRTFVEFGVEDYLESNTRFLLIKDNWVGLVIDGSKENISKIKSDAIYWRHNLKATHAFVTRENINSLLRDNGLTGDIGLLSIDIDGNDYWVWDAITEVNPTIVVCEFNWRYGGERSVTIPYDPSFSRKSAHPSMVYYGASLTALWSLGRKRGYDLVCCNSAMNNAFFVRSNLRPQSMPALRPSQCFSPGQFREARSTSGNLLMIDPADEPMLLTGLPLVEVAAPDEL